MARLLILKITNRYNQGLKLQEVLTTFGCEIKTRLGLHETGSDFCSEEGLIILELYGTSEKIESLKKELEKLKGLKQKYLEI